MGRGGKNRLPDAVKIARGTYRPDRALNPPPGYRKRVRSEPRAKREPVGSELKPHWSLSPAEVEIWREVAPRVRLRGVNVPAVLSEFCAVAVRIIGNPTPSAADMAEYRDLMAQLGISEVTP
jgi:hypothetical protein